MPIPAPVVQGALGRLPTALEKLQLLPFQGDEFIQQGSQGALG